MLGTTAVTTDSHASAARPRPAPNRTTTVFLRRLVLFGAPLALGVLLLWHPVFLDDDPVGQVAPQADWWLLLHLLTIPLFGLFALAIALLVAGLPGRAASLSRGAVAVGIVYYTAYETLAGVASGLLLRHARALPADQQAVVGQAVVALTNDPTLNLFVLVGGLGFIIGAIAAAAALARAGAPRPAVICLVLALLALAGGHVPPFAQVSMVLFGLAAVLVEFAPRRRAPRPASSAAAVVASQ